mgnify:CR=1 FL=1
METAPLCVGAGGEDPTPAVADAPKPGATLKQSTPEPDPSRFDDAERVAFAKHMNWALGDVPDVAAIDPHSATSFFYAVSNTLLLPRYIRCVDPLALDERALNLPEPGRSLRGMHALQNHTLCLQAATAIGCGVRGLSPQQLGSAQHNAQLVLQLLWNLIRAKLLTPLKPTDPAVSAAAVWGCSGGAVYPHRPHG